jgi:hypothetical protein
MGKWSKKVGERGEEIAADFLHMIGWESLQSGIQLPCVKPEQHRRTDSDRTTHGIDYLFTYTSPLSDGVGLNVVVSVKFSAEPYPRTPITVFKQHFTDLARTLECFKNSEARRASSQVIKGVAKTQDVGVLLWINNDREGSSDVISQVNRVVLPDTLRYEAIYVVDNRRAQFVFDTMSFAKQLANGCGVTWFYADTGKNVNPLSKIKHGSLLPVEYVNSSVLALRVADETSRNRTLILSTLEDFSESGLKRLLGLTQNLSQDWCSKVIVAFPDYDVLRHGNAVQAARGYFLNGTALSNVEVRCYDDDYRSVRH